MTESEAPPLLKDKTGMSTTLSVNATALHCLDHVAHPTVNNLVQGLHCGISLLWHNWNVQAHVSRPTHVAGCWRGHSCPYRARKCCWFLHDEDGEGSACAATARAAFPLPSASLLLEMIQQRIVEPIVDEPVLLAEFVGVWEQIVDVPVLRTMEDDVGVVRFTPQERVQNRTPVQVMDFPVPQIIENSLPFAPQEHVQYRVPEQAVGVLVPLITEDGLLGVPQERVQNRMLVDTVGVLVPQITQDGLPIVPQERVLNRVVEQISGVPVPQIIEDSLPVVPQERVQNRTSEQIMGFLEPQVMEYGLPAVPQECVQNRTPEQLVDVPVPQIMEAIEENRFPEQLVDVPVPQIMEAIAEDRFPEQIVNSPVPQFFEAIMENRVGEQMVDSSVPQFMEAAVEIMPSLRLESVQNRTPEQIMDFPAPPNMEVYAGRVRAPPQERVQNRILEPVSTGKVFTVKLRHHRDDHASSDNVGFIKGLDKHNMPRFGDVMVPPPQIIKGFLGFMWLLTCLCTAFKQSVRAAAAAPSSNAELVCFQQSGVRRARLRARQLGSLQFFDRGHCCLGCSLELLDIIS